MITQTRSGSASTNAASASKRTAVLVGLFGLQTISRRVFAVTAAASASRSWRSSASSGTVTAVAPEIASSCG